MALRSCMLCFLLLAHFSSVASSSWIDQDAGKAKMRKETSSEEVAQETQPIAALHEADADLDDGAELQDEESEGDGEMGEAEEEDEGDADMHEAEEEEGEADMHEAEEDSDLHYVPQKSLLELARMHEHGNATKDAVFALISDEYEQSLPDHELMVPIRLEGHTEHLPAILEQMEPTSFVEAVMTGRSDPDLKPVQLMELRQDSGTDEGEEHEDEEEEQHEESGQELAEDENREVEGAEEGEAESDDGLEGEERAEDAEEDNADAFTGDDSSDAAIRKKLKELGF